MSELAPSPTLSYASAPSRSFVGHAKLIGGLTLVSRFTGLAREIVAGHYLGTGLVASAFTVAFTIPNLFRKLFGEGALSAAFIPLYSQAIRREEITAAGTSVEHPPIAPGAPGSASVVDYEREVVQSAADFATASVNLLCVILLALTLVGEAILLTLIAFERNHDHLLTLKFTAIMLPYVLLICGTAFLGGILQVHKRFGAPAAAPIILNVCHVAVVFIGAWLLHLHRGLSVQATLAKQTTLAYWLSFFVLVAGVMQVAVLLPSLRAIGFRFRSVLHVWTPAIRKMLKLTVPVALGAGVLQLSVLLDKGISMLLMQDQDPTGHVITHFSLLGHIIRYPMENGAPARLNVAQFLYQFPLGVFAIALATAIFPNLSAVALDKDRGHFKAVLRQGIEATLFEGLAASVGLILIRVPATRLLFQHGLVSAHDADLIAQSVLYYSAAIWAFSLQQILNRAYYALHDTTTPLVMSMLTLAVNLAVEVPLVWHLGEAGMAVGTLVSFAAQAIIMLYMLDRRLDGLGLGQVLMPFIKMLIATALMTAVCLGVMYSPLYPRGDHRIDWAVQLFMIMGVGTLVYVGACAGMGLETLKHILPKRRRANR